MVAQIGSCVGSSRQHWLRSMLLTLAPDLKLVLHARKALDGSFCLQLFKSGGIVGDKILKRSIGNRLSETAQAAGVFGYTLPSDLQPDGSEKLRGQPRNAFHAEAESNGSAEQLQAELQELIHERKFAEAAKTVQLLAQDPIHLERRAVSAVVEGALPQCS